MTINKNVNFWNKVSRKYSASPVKHPASYKKKLNATQTYLKPWMEVLEIGCGTGTTALIHAPFVRHIHAIDFSQKMVEISKGKVAETGISNVTFECKDVFDLEDQSIKYDLIMAHSILHVIDKKERVIDLIFDLLNPQGLFVISTLCLKNQPRLLKFIAPILSKLGIFPQLSFFSKESLIENLKSAGFEIEYCWEPPKPEAIFVIAKKIS